MTWLGSGWFLPSVFFFIQSRIEFSNPYVLSSTFTDETCRRLLSFLPPVELLLRLFTRERFLLLCSVPVCIFFDVVRRTLTVNEKCASSSVRRGSNPENLHTKKKSKLASWYLLVHRGWGEGIAISLHHFIFLFSPPLTIFVFLFFVNTGKHFRRLSEWRGGGGV